MDAHEMYCAGHLIEAGIAYLLATGDRTLLDVGVRMVDHMMSVFDQANATGSPATKRLNWLLQNFTA